MNKIRDEGIERESNIPNKDFDSIIIVSVEGCTVCPACLLAENVHCNEVVVNIGDEDAGSWMVETIDEGEDDPYDGTALPVGVVIQTGVNVYRLYGELCVYEVLLRYRVLLDVEVLELEFLLVLLDDDVLEVVEF